MGMLDAFRPKWKHSDPTVRRAALEKLEDQAQIAEMARTDEDWNLREAAFARLTDHAILAGIAQTGWEEERVRILAIEKLDDPVLLAEIARKDENKAIREVAIGKITDQPTLYGIARKFVETSSICLAAIRQMTDQSLLIEIARDDIRLSGDVRQAAVKRVAELERSFPSSRPAPGPETPPLTENELKKLSVGIESHDLSSTTGLLERAISSALRVSTREEIGAGLGKIRYKISDGILLVGEIVYITAFVADVLGIWMQRPGFRGFSTVSGNSYGYVQVFGFFESPGHRFSRLIRIWKGKDGVWASSDADFEDHFRKKIPPGIREVNPGDLYPDSPARDSLPPGIESGLRSEDGIEIPELAAAVDLLFNQAVLILPILSCQEFGEKLGDCSADNGTEMVAKGELADVEKAVVRVLGIFLAAAEGFECFSVKVVQDGKLALIRVCCRGLGKSSCVRLWRGENEFLAALVGCRLPSPAS